MDGELVSEPSDDSGDGDKPPLPQTYSEVFHQHFPHYLAMGMSPDDFWNGESTLVVAYRKANEIKNQKLNEQLWLQGMYIYEALCDAAPLFRSFGKSIKAHPYPSEPYCLTEEEREKKRERDEKAEYEKGRARIEEFLRMTNPKPEAEVKEDADNR